MNSYKSIFALFLTTLGLYFQNIMIPISVLTILMVIDYATGMTNAWIQKDLSSKKGIQGIIKKVGYFVVIAIAMVADYLIIEVAKTIGLNIPQTLSAVALLVTVWLILNECISILENLAKIGTPMPAFLKKLIEKLQQTTEEKGDAE